MHDAGIDGNAAYDPGGAWAVSLLDNGRRLIECGSKVAGFRRRDVL